MTMRSVGASPERMTRKPSTIGPSSTSLVPTVPSSATVKTILLDWSDAIALSGIEQRLVLAAEQAQPPEEAGGQQAVLVVEDGAAADGAGLRIERVVDEIHPALMLVFGLVREPHRDRVLHVAGGGPRAGGGEPQVAQEVRLAAVEDEVNGIDRHDDGQQRRAGLAAGDEIAGIDAPVGDAPADRRAHLGPFEIELAPASSAACAEATWPAASRWVDCPGIEFALGQALAAHQRGGALDVEVAISSLACARSTSALACSTASL